MKNLLATKNTSERGMLHMELLSDLDEVATQMSSPDPKVSLSAADYIITPPSSSLDILYSFLTECFAGK